MSLKYLFVKVLCIYLLLASTSSLSSENMARDFIEHVLRIPNSEKVLNSVLGRLERSRQRSFNEPRATDDSDCDDPSDKLPEYTESLQISRERELRQLGTQSRQGLPPRMMQKHYPICHLERKIRKLNTNEYEYRPAYYEEVRCTMSPVEDIGVTNEQHTSEQNTLRPTPLLHFIKHFQICSSLGFSCVQWNKTIHLTRRRYASDCWETRTMVIPAGCECMWSVHKLGDMKLHAQT